MIFYLKKDFYFTFTEFYRQNMNWQNVTVMHSTKCVIYIGLTTILVVINIC